MATKTKVVNIKNRTVGFFYLLLRDHLTIGEIDKILMQESQYIYGYPADNPDLVAYVEKIVEKLKGNHIDHPSQENYQPNDDSVKLINQRLDYDCAVAVVAMFLKTTYKKSYETLSHVSQNKDLNDPGGFQMSDIRKAIEGSTSCRHTHNPVKKGIEAILLVPSLNVEGSQHYVYRDAEGFIYDPNTNREGKQWYKPSDNPEINLYLFKD